MATNMTRMQHQINQLSRELEEVTENRTKRDTANNKDDSVIEILRSDNLQKDNLRNYALNTPEKQMREKGMHFIGKRKNNN